MRRLVPLLTIATLGCTAPPPPTTAAELPPVQVSTLHLALASQPLRDEVVGTVRARVRADLEAKVSGRILKLLVRPGDAVKPLQLIATLDVEDIKARVAQAQATLTQADAELARYETLGAQGAATNQQVEGVRAQQAIAKAALKEAQSVVDYAQVRAPFAGTITRTLALVGDLAAPGRPIVELEDLRTLRLEVEVPEGLVGVVAVGLRVPVDVAGQSLEGKVAEVSPAADPNSRTFLVKIDLPAQAGLHPGQFGRAFISSRRMEILRVPLTAILHRGQLEFVFLVKDARAHLRLIRTGKRFGDDIEVVAGLEADETLVTTPPRSLVDGQPVVTQ